MECVKGPCEFDLVYTNSNYGDVLPGEVKEINFEQSRI